MHTSLFISGLTALASLVTAAPHSGSHNTIHKRCDFDSKTSPECWGDYSLSTNWYDEVPDTGVVREFWWEVTNTTAAPDGVSRIVLAINGSFPGPTLVADWGDTVVVHLTNKLDKNGTSIHWHGIRQNGTYQHDGVASITQCPTAGGGETITYRWRATQYGSTWYHSHYSLQAYNGVLGGIIINGPASAPYDEDKGILFLNDWTHKTSDELWDAAQSGGPPTANNGLINGTNVYGDGGSRSTTSVTSGNTYRLRLVNGAIDTHWKFMIDNHTMTVIAADLVPVEPYTLDVLNIGIGQRYDILVTANQTAGNYWMRAIPQLACSANEMTNNIKAVWNYDSVALADPTTTGFTYVDGCDDETPFLTPFLPLDVGSDAVEHEFDIGLTTVNDFFHWTINNNIFMTNYSSPTVKRVANNGTFAVTEHVTYVTEEKDFVYFVIESALALPHPIHLHGHDFWVIGQEASATFSNTTALNLKNPMRRDVAMLPAAGYLVIAFKPDNPGIWLMHCHIGWHTSEGLGLQLVEGIEKMTAATDLTLMNDQCDAWDKFASSAGIVQDDSGI